MSRAFGLGTSKKVRFRKAPGLGGLIPWLDTLNPNVEA